MLLLSFAVPAFLGVAYAVSFNFRSEFAVRRLSNLARNGQAEEQASHVESVCGFIPPQFGMTSLLNAIKVISQSPEQSLRTPIDEPDIRYKMYQ